ncbi:MAG: phosphate ABC transporter ATP-binding protein [Chloroflexota bacterium]
MGNEPHLMQNGRVTQGMDQLISSTPIFATPRMPMAYQLDQVTHRYGERVILHIESWGVPTGEIVALVGPSGAGKSTLLRLLNFLEMPTAGSIQFQGNTLHAGVNIPMALRRQVTMVFQRPLLLSTSVINNVAYGLRLRRTSDAHKVAMTALEQVGLAHLARKPAHTVSGGEAQRVALARAIVLNPQVLLLDEPTANLDPANVQMIEQTIVDLHRRSSTTIVLVTHNIFQARRVAQYATLLLEGQIVESADVATFFDAPRDERTAAFVRGDMIY